MLRFQRRNSNADSSDTGSNVGDDDKAASPASRLRAALSRLGPSTPPERRKISFSESESDLNPAFSARKSLKDVFSRAMRESNDSLDTKRSSAKAAADSDRDEPADSQLSDSSLPLSAQATSLQLLRQHLDLPEASSRFEASRSTTKASGSHQDLRRLLETAQANPESDLSADTAKPSTSHRREGAMDEEGSINTPPLRPSSPPETATPRRNNSSITESSRGIGQTTGSYLSEEDEKDLLLTQNNVAKTPRPPGGWVTPSRSNGNGLDSDPSMSMAVGQTPAPPGAWKATPMANERKGILKVRFDESTALEPTHNNGIDAASDVDDEPGPARAVRLVDSFGRERRFDEDGQEIDLPQVSLAKELSMSKRSPSVRLVDSMGNELDPSTISPDNTSDLGDVNGYDIVTRMSSNIADARRNIENIESRQTALRTRKVIKQHTISHDRILELAMESREARIERERLLRQSHLVRVRDEALSKQVVKLERGPLLPSNISKMISSSGIPKWSLPILLLLHLLLLWLLYSSARAYVRHYFLTSYYDPFFPIVDPTPIQRIPFLRFTFLPSRWRAFNTPGTGQLFINLVASLERANRHLLALVSKPLMDLDIKLPS